MEATAFCAPSIWPSTPPKPPPLPLVAPLPKMPRSAIVLKLPPVSQFFSGLVTAMSNTVLASCWPAFFSASVIEPPLNSASLMPSMPSLTVEKMSSQARLGRLQLLVVADLLGDQRVGVVVEPGALHRRGDILLGRRAEHLLALELRELLLPRLAPWPIASASADGSAVLACAFLASAP
jgi:hypothetical protein